MFEDKKEEKKFYDLFTKVKRVFTTDIYIVNCEEIYPGEKSALNLSGSFVLEIPDEFQEVLKKEFRNSAGEIQRRIFIENIDEFKKGLISYKSFESDLDTKTFDETTFEMRRSFAKFKSSNNIWSKFRLSETAEENEKLLERFFEDKLVVNLKDPSNKYPDAMIGCSFLPSVAGKLVDDLYYAIDLYEELKTETIYSLRFLFEFSHYTMYCQYFYI